MTFMRRTTPAIGCRRVNRSGIETGIIFDAEMFAAIRQRALQEGTSFAEQVRTLCQWGLDDAETDRALRRRA